MTSDEQSWFQALSKGDEQAFRNIYYRYWKAIYHAANRFLKSPELAQDVVVNVFSDLWTRRTDFADAKEMRNFMITASRDLTYKHLKQIATEWNTKTKK